MDHERNRANALQRDWGKGPSRQRPPKRKLCLEERQRRRDAARHKREAERRSLASLHDVHVEPRVDATTLAARRAEMPDQDTRDLTGRVFGDPNPADRRRECGS